MQQSCLVLRFGFCTRPSSQQSRFLNFSGEPKALARFPCFYRSWGVSFASVGSSVLVTKGFTNTRALVCSSLCRKQSQEILCQAQAQGADFPKWIIRANDTLSLAIHNVTDYAEYLKEAGDSHSEVAFEVLAWLESKKENLTKTCVQSGGKGAKECTDLEHMGRLVSDLEQECGIEDLVHVLACQCHAEKGKLASKPREHSKEHTSSLPGHVHPTEEDLMTVFEHMDRNKDGKLDMVEFADAMEAIGDPLSSPTLSIITESFDLHGSLGYEEFKEIVSAEEVRAHTPASKNLRRLARNIRSQVDHTPDWGT
uniref:EF-hand domain-containing protein n=1 Tax=Tetraselmis sp. GSL018 TaxID=582737 RepID=A0A061S3X6_9CHLO